MVWNSTSPDGTKSVKANETIIQANTTYIETELNKDHFWNIGANEDGRHKFAQMPKYVDGAPATPTSPTIAAGMDLAYFSRLKTAIEATVAQDVQPYARNANAIMQLLGIRACVVFNYAAGAAQTIVYSHNVTSVTKTASGNYTITYTAALPTNSYLVLGNAVRNNADTGKGILLSLQGNTVLNNVKSTAMCKINTFSQAGSIVDPLQTWVVMFGG